MSNGGSKRWSVACLALVCLAPVPAAADQASAERGRDHVLHRPLNPPIWSMKAYDQSWKRWGLKEKPADYDDAFRERYGLVTAPFDNHGLPLGLIQEQGLLGKRISHNCLICHAGRIAGQTVIGVGNASLDLQSLFEDLTAADGFVLRYPFPIVQERAAHGRKLFLDTCAKCHGSYGPGGSYPNKIVPLGVIGTDRTLAEAISKRNLDYFNKSWFGQQLADDGQLLQVTE